MVIGRSGEASGGVNICSEKEVGIHFDGSLTDKNEEVAVTECLG